MKGCDNLWDDKIHKMLLDGIVILVDIGFNHIEINDIVLNNRLTSTLGCYYHENRIIEISTKHFMFSDKEEVMNTIIHELSHNICDLKYGSNMVNDGHSKEWFEIAKFISENTNYKIEQYGDTNINVAEIPRIEYFFHDVKCSVCNNREWLISKYSNYSDVKRKKICPNCQYSSNKKIIMNCYKTSHDHYKYII
jgi:predicted SprT family Zn-dependent metalloprotease